MNFNNLVLNMLNESPDGITFGGDYYSYDNNEGNPHTVIVDNLLVVADLKKPWTGEEQEDINSFPLPFGPILISASYDSFPSRVESSSHTNLFYLLGILKYSYTQMVEAGITFYSPKLDINKYLKEMASKNPRMALYTKHDIETADSINLGRFWEIGNKIVVSMWDTDDDKNIIKQYILPFIKQSHPQIKEENILFENPTNEDEFEQASSFSLNQEIKAPQKEIANLLRQLHLASGNTAKRNKIEKEIIEIANKHGINPEKYGIVTDKDKTIAKPSQAYASKVLGTSKEPMASLKSKMMTSEKLEQIE